MTLPITVLPFNDAPTIDVTALVTTAVPALPVRQVREDNAAGLLFSGINVNDLADQAFDQHTIRLELTLSVLHGGLTINPSGATLDAAVSMLATATGSAPDPANVTGSYEVVRLVGTINELNAALGTLRYFNDLNFNTVSVGERLQITVHDLGNTDYRTPGFPTVSGDRTAGTALTASTSLDLTVLAVNDAPVVTAPTLGEVAEDAKFGPLVFNAANGNAIRVVDVDAEEVGPDNIDGGRLAVSLSVSFGTLTLGGTSNLTVLTGDGSSTILFHGRQADFVTALNGLTYRPNPNFNNNIGSEKLVINVNDQGNTGEEPVSPGYLEHVVTIPISVVPINDVPEFTLNPGLLPNIMVLEDGPEALGTSIPMVATNIAAGPASATDENNPTTGQALDFLLTVTNVTGTLAFQTLPGGGPDIDIYIDAHNPADPRNGALTFRTLPDTNGTAIIEVRLKDDGGTAFGGVDTTLVQRFTLTVTAVNDVPLVLVDSTLKNPTRDEDSGLVVISDWATTVLPGPLTATDEFTQLLTATVSVTATGGLTFARPIEFDPATGDLTFETSENSNGSATFNVTVSDGGKMTTVGPYTLTVLAINDPPVPRPTDALDLVRHSYGTDEDTLLAINVTDLTTTVATKDLPGPADESGQVLTLTAVATASAAGGAVTLNGAQISYTPAQDFFGTDTFTYTITDNGQSRGVNDFRFATGTITVLVNAVNDAPVAVNDPPADLVGAYTTDEDTILLVAGVGTIQNDTDVDSTNLTIAPNGLDTSATSLPRATLGKVTFLDVEVVGMPGTFIKNGDFRYEPNGKFESLSVGQSDTDLFRYKITDGQLESNWATVTIRITGVNDAPAVQPIARTINENVSLSAIPFAGSDVDSDHLPQDLVYNIVSPTTLGTLRKGTADAADAQKFYFDPGTDFDDLQLGDSARVVKFTYTATDKHGAVSALATVTITVNGQNDAPIARNVTISTPANAVTVAPFDADDADHDDNPSTLNYTVDDSGFTGTESVTVGDSLPSTPPQGSFAFNPGAGYVPLAAGATTTIVFPYTATDAHLASAMASVTVVVTGVNDAPTAQPVSIQAVENGPSVSGAFLGDDVDTDDSPSSLIYTLIGQLPASSGTLVNNTTGTFTFSPGTDFQDLAEGVTRDITFRYNAKDRHGTSSPTATGTITVTGKNDAPKVSGLSLATGENQTLTASFAGSDVDAGAVLSFGTNALQGVGNLTNNANGTFTFNPGTAFDHLASGTTAQVTFTYLASDGLAQSGLATVTITVNGVNDAPTAQTPTMQSVNVAVVEDGPIVAAQFIGDDVDDDDDATSLAYTITSTPTAGNVIHSGGRNFSFDPGPDFQDLYEGEVRTLTFNYEVRDRFGQLSATPGTVTVTVTGRNDAPVVSNISGIVAVENGPVVTGNYIAQDVDSDETGSGIAFTVVSQPTEGTVTPPTTAAGTKTFTFNPGLAFQDLSVGQSRQVTFTYRAADTHGGVSQLGTVTVTVNGANDAPVAQNILGVTAVEDGSPVSITLKATDIDSDETGSTLSYAIKTSPPVGGGTVSVSGVPGNAIAIFDPGNDFQDLFVGQTRTVTFTYSASDQHGLEGNVATFTVVVTGVNDAPVAQNQIVTDVNEDGPAKMGTFVATDADSDGAAAGFTYSILAQPTHGRVTISGTPGDATFSFDPRGDFNDLSLNATRDVTFTYQVTDTHNGVGTGTVTVTVVGANDLPTVSTVNVSANENGVPVTRAFAGADVDSDDSQQTLTYQFTSELPAAQGTIIKDPSNLRQFIYDPGLSFQELSLNEIGLAQVAYTATDGHNSTSAAGTISISVLGANDAPTATSLSFNVDEGSSLTQFFGGDDVDNDDSLASLQFTLVNLPPTAVGTVTNIGGSRFTFVPGSSFESLALGEPGTASFTYLARDRHGVASNEATVTITVVGVNDKPVVQNLSLGAVEDGGPVGGTFAGTDIDSDDTPSTITFNVVSPPSEGSANGSGGNAFVFDPGTAFQNLGVNQARTVTFTYTATDRHGAVSDPGIVTVTVTGVNDAPIARDDQAATNEGQIQTIDVIHGADVGSRDTDPDGDALTISDHQATSAKGAAIGLSANGILSYNPATSATLNGLAAGQVTTDTFAYTVSDGHGGTATATVTVTVTGINNAPLALNDSFVASADAILSISAPGVLGGDTDPDPGTTLSVFSMGLVSLRGATITSDGNGGFTYDPTSVVGFRLLAANESLDDTFTYVASDGSLTSNVATVTITVNGVNDTPIVKSESYTTAEDTTLQVSAFAGVLANDRDVENDPLTVTLVTGVANGALSLGGNGAFTYTPALNFNGNDAFVYRVSDGNSSATATATIVVTSVNDAPVAVADQYSMSQGTTLQIAALTGVLANDSDVDDPRSALQAIARSLPTNGAVTLSGDGHFTYTPTADFSGISTFTYQAVDPSGARSALTTVQITVNAVNGVAWHNTPRPLDVNNDGTLAPIDALQIINDLNLNGSRLLPALQGGPPFLDVNNDGYVTPIDVLLVVNELNRGNAGSEGEGPVAGGGDDSLASELLNVVATTDAIHLSGLLTASAANASARPRWLSSPMFKVEDGQLGLIDGPSAVARRLDTLTEPTRRLDPISGGWNNLLTHLASDHRPSSSIDKALATLNDDSADLLDDILDDLF